MGPTACSDLGGIPQCQARTASTWIGRRGVSRASSSQAASAGCCSGWPSAASPPASPAGCCWRPCSGSATWGCSPAPDSPRPLRHPVRASRALPARLRLRSVPGQHVCAVVSSPDEQYRILSPYVREGLEAGRSLLTIVEADLHDEHRGRMREGVVAVDAALESGQLKLLASNDTYLRD